MANNLANNTALLVLRLGFSGMMLTYGIPKLMRVFEGDLSFGDPIGIGSTASLILVIIGEAICPVLLIVGFKTRWMAIPPAITMAVAAFVVHADDPFETKEKALLFLVGFVAIALLGAGKYSIDKK